MSTMATFDPDIAWILVAWLMPLWWAILLLMVGWLGDVFPSWRSRATRLFDDLESIDLT